jgi:hypothetical protein
MNAPIAWINGALCPFTQAAVPVWDLGVVAGASVTEMARTFALTSSIVRARTADAGSA